VVGTVDLNVVWKVDWVRPETRKHESERKRGAELEKDEKKPWRCWIRKEVRKEFSSIQRHSPPPLGSRRDALCFNATR
jgi:hypothetical protein